MSVQGKGRSAKEILKRIDYFGSLSLMLSVCFYISFISIDVQSQSGSKVGATLVFLSVRYNESLPASSLLPAYQLRTNSYYPVVESRRYYIHYFSMHIRYPLSHR